MLIPKKSLGQNFLLDRNICKKIVNTIKIKDEIILEIGPGTGQLTKEILLKKPKKLILIEKDSKLCQLLKEKFSNLNNIEILNEDALHFIYETNKKINIISNLPYNISTKLIIYLLKNYKNINFLILMLQKEVAIKMDTELSKKNKLNFFIEFLSDYKILFNVSNKVFYPKPKIKSSVISIKDFELFVIERGPGHLLYENGDFTNDHWFPQFNYVQYSNGQNFIDFIGKFENLKNDTDKLAGKVTSFSGINVRGIDTTYKEYYKNGLQNIVSNIYKKDLELFNYEF